MNFIASALIYHAEDYISFWLFVSVIETFELRDVYIKSKIIIYI